MKFEKRIIDPILNIIKNNQEYLTQQENLPQLAKLGYIYNTLWYAGRISSYQGNIETNQCDDNPKYKIEMCEPKSDIIENYIYDAWGMHVSNWFGPNWNEFNGIIVNGKELTDLEIKNNKQNKTFEEWVEVFTHPENKYKFENRKEIADYLLCVIGTGYSFVNGFIIKTASGASQDITDYGDWKNAKFNSKIQKVIDKIMSDPDTEKVIKNVEAAKKEYDEKELNEKFEFNSKWSKLIDLVDKLKKPKYKKYYSICKYSPIKNITKDSDPSYIKAAIEICEDIITHKENEEKDNVEFAQRFLELI